jgi:hypothetical protein
VDRSGEQVCSHVLDFSPTGGLLGWEAREGADWAAEAAQEYMPDEVGVF